MSDAIVDAVVPELEEHIRQEVANQRVIGLSIGIVRDQELAWSAGFGHVDLGDSRPPDARTLFRFDSNTKPVTGMAIMQLRDEGLLGLEDRLVEYIPEFAGVQQIAGSVDDVTLRRLLTHRSGLSGEVPGSWHATGTGPTIEEVLERIGECGLVIPPDSQHKYCNLGFVLLGEVVARLSGRPYAEYVQAEILEPLAMLDSTFEPDSSELRRVTQHAWSPVSGGPGAARNLVFNGRMPAGGLHSTVEDMAKWISLQFRRSRELSRGGSQIIAGTTLQEMHRLQYADDDWNEGWAISFGAVRRGDRVYLGHGGGNPGSSTRTAFHVASRTGVIVATNSDGHTAAVDIALDTLDRIGAAEAAAPAPLPPGPTPAPDWARRYIGLYGSTAGDTGYGGPRRVAWLDDGLALLGPGVDLPREVVAASAAFPCHLDPTDDPLALRVRDGRLAGELLRFSEGSDGTMRAFDSIGLTFHRLSPGS